MKLLPILMLLCLLGATSAFNFNIFRWPSFKKGGSGYGKSSHGGNSGGGHGGGGHGGGGGGYGGSGSGYRQQKSNPLQGILDLKAKAFNGLRQLKAPIIDGLRNLKSSLFHQKSKALSSLKSGFSFNKGGNKGGSSSYHRRPASHYGETQNNGYFQVTPSTQYGAPQAAPSTGYGAPQSPATSYGAPQSPATSYGAPQQAPSSGYGAPQAAPSSNYGAPQAPSSGYGAPKASSTGYGAAQATPTRYGDTQGSSGHSGGQTGGHSGAQTGGHSSGQTGGYSGGQTGGHSGGQTGGAQTGGYSGAQTGGHSGGQTGVGQTSSYSSSQTGGQSGGQTGGHSASASGYRGGQAGGSASASGYRGGQTGSTGFRPSSPIGQNHGSSQQGSGQQSYNNQGSSQQGNVQQSFNNQGSSQQGNVQQSYQPQQISPPLETAMNLGHLLPEQQVITGTGTTQWRPVAGTTGAAPGLYQSTQAPDIDLRRVSTFAPANALTSSPRSVTSNVGIVSQSANDFAKSLDQQRGVGTISPTALGNQFAEVEDDGGFLLAGTEEYDDIIELDEDVGSASTDQAAQQLSKLLDNVIHVGQASISNSIQTGTRGRAITGSRPQENVLSTELEVLSTGVRASRGLQSGQQSNMMFAGLMEELQLTTLTTLIRRANLEAMLTTEGGFTIFAPSDSAFTYLPRSAIQKLQNNTEKLREVILFHVIPGVLGIDDLQDNQLITTTSPRGRQLRVNVYNHGADEEAVVTLNGARVKRPDMLATNGVIHVIDRVLYPMADLSIIDHLTTCDTFTGANVAVTGAGLAGVLAGSGPYTVFLPTTEAFAAIDNATVSSFIQNITMLQNVLLFHIIPGTYFSEGLRDGQWLPTLAGDAEVQLKVSSDGHTRRLSGIGHIARVLKADIVATNGVIHVIDTVMRPERETPICGHF